MCLFKTFTFCSAEQREESLRGWKCDKEPWFVASQGPIGGLWWQSPMCLLINVFSFWIFIPDLVCKQRLDDVFRSKSPIRVAAYSHSPHEYLICVAAITHFSSPLCPLVDVSLAGVCALMNVYGCVAVQAGAAGVSYREGAHPEVFRSVSLSNRSSGIQGGEAWWDQNLWQKQK